MIAQILANTPVWVFALLILLVVFGLMQTRTRTVRKLPALLLPAGMIALSLAGIHSSFGFAFVPLASWAGALVFAAFIGYALFRDKRVSYDATAGTFFVPGSWAPLAVIMAIFIAKYAYAVMRGFNAAVTAPTVFVVVLSAIIWTAQRLLRCKGAELDQGGTQGLNAASAAAVAPPLLPVPMIPQ